MIGDSRPRAVEAGRIAGARPLEREFELLAEMTDTIQQAAEKLVAGLEGRITFTEAWQVVRDLEHKGDAVARDLFDALLAPRSGVDTDALKALTGYLDDMLDGIEAAAARLAIYRIRRPITPALELGRLVLESAQEINLAVGSLARMQDVFPHTRALHRLENRGDDLLREALEVTFSGRANPKDIIKWKDICETLEGATDRGEDIANVVETLVVQAGGEGKLIAGELVMDIDRHEVTVKGKPLPLSAKEYDVLHLLLRHQGKVVRRERLLQEVWGGDYFGDARTLDTHIGWIRKKVETSGGVRIVAVRGIGYRLDLQA